MARWKIDRRTFLRGTGAAVSLPLLDIMGTRSFATEATTQAPQRLVSIFQPNGVYPKAWDVTGTGSNFDFSPILSPLKHLKEDLLIVSNLDNSPRGNHVRMTSAFLTAVGVENSICAVSLDQMVARKIGQETRLPSIVLGTEPPRQGGDGSLPISFANTVSWSSETTRISPEINPRVAFDRLFRTQTSPQARQAAQDRQSVLDLVRDDAHRIRKQASQQDKHKLDEYLESVRSVEVQIERALNPPKNTWTPDSLPELIPPPEGIPRRRDEHLRLMIDLMVMALQTDSTRVGTLMTAHGFSRQNFSFLNGVSSDHHGMSHHKDQETAVAEYTRVSTWYIEQLAYMLDKMKAIPEGEGTLLDNSLVLYGSGMKDGNGHKKDNLPIVMAGRGGGVMTPGRHLQIKNPTPLANLLFSISQGFGVEGDNFNGVSTGLISELTV